MSRKGDGRRRRGRGRRTDLTNAFARGERSLFVLASKAVLLVAFVYVIFLGATANLVFVSALAAVATFVIASIILPLDTVREWAESLWTGEAGERAHSWWTRLLPFRDDDRRGQVDGRALFLAVIVVLSVLAGIHLAAAGTALADEDDRDCHEVIHDAYLTDDGVVAAFEEHSEAEVTDRNIYTRIEDTDAFVRLHGENPNSYCVSVSVKLHPDIIPPAEVGEVSARDGDTESTWRHVHDFDRDESYTEITFTLDSGEEVLFAPNKVRVLSIAWKDDATSTANGILERIPNPLSSDDDLEQRTYRLNSSNGSMMTVPLADENGEIDDWQAAYRVGANDWRPIDTDSDAPAFYREADDGRSVQFIFDDDTDAEIQVEFTANPRLRDKAKHEYRSARADWSDFFDFEFSIFGSITPALEAAPTEVAT